MCSSFTCSSVSGFVSYLGEDLGERRQAGQLHQVEPGLIKDPAPWFGFDRVQIQRGSAYIHTNKLLSNDFDKKRKGWREEEEEDGCVTFDEGEHLGVRDVSGLQVDLQSQQQREQQFVFLIQAPGCVTVHLREGQTGTVTPAENCMSNQNLKRVQTGQLHFPTMSGVVVTLDQIMSVIDG